MSDALRRLTDLAAPGEVVVLSGAGLSTESGIPDYRGPTSGARRFAPMTYQNFTGDPVARRRYWARSHLGWRRIAGARPNDGHRAVGRLQRHGLVTGIVTQNVDGLHQAGGAEPVLELHGSLDRVVCLRCGDLSERAELERRLSEANPDFAVPEVPVNPDGDMALSDEDAACFHIVGCVVCKGVLKPDVVFFGESVPAQRVAQAHELVEGAKLVLVLGSSLAVLSGRRFVLKAARLGVPVAIINKGPTRGDHCAALSIDAPLGTVLPRLCASLGLAG